MTYPSIGWSYFVLMVIICKEISLSKASYNLTTDEYALLTIKNKISSDPNNIFLKNWTQGTPVCNWYGVTCGKRHSRVTSLRLLSNGLGGTIPPEIGNLSFLVFLDISNNSLVGNIPSEIGYLNRLKHLSLQYNELTGQIPPIFSSFNRLQLLDLSDNNLIGNIPFSIFNISSLSVVDLGDNQLQGTLPSDICKNLPRIQALFASGNLLGGELPSLKKCAKAVYISLSINQFTGNFPKEIGNLSALQELYLGINNLTGSFPKDIGNAPSLQILSLLENKFTSIIPPSFGNLSNLVMMDIGTNNLEGEIPFQLVHLPNLEELYLNIDNLNGDMGIFNCSKLRFLGLTGNNISSFLPPDMGIRLPNLQGVYLGENQLTGPIPSSISNWTKIQSIDLGFNILTGDIPVAFGNLLQLQNIILQDNQLTSDLELEFLTSLTNCPNLNKIKVSYNLFDGFLPRSLSNMSTSLVMFHAVGCGLKGVIPNEVGNLSNLYWLSLDNNDLRGQIPDATMGLRMLQALTIRNNRIEGKLPIGLCNLESLYDLDLGKNKFWGEIPSCLGNITSLRGLFLDSNSLTSSLSSTFWSNKGLLVLNLTSNFLNGSLITEIGNSIGIEELYLDRNKFSGELPPSIGNLQNLATLSLSVNMFNGSIPDTFGDVFSLRYLDLSNNHLIGIIPKSLNKLRSLEYLNLSYNELSGEIPNGGPFANFSVGSFIGNDALCGAPQFHVKECKNGNSRRSNSRKDRVLEYVLPLSIVVLLAVGFTIRVLRFRPKAKNLLNENVLIAHVRRFSYSDILNATNNFDEVNLLGRGSFGSVYKATFSNGSVAAVKLFNSKNEDAFKSFDRECKVMREIRHRNLVKVISTCSNVDIKALVLEYMPNGSLEKWLYSKDSWLDIIQKMGAMVDVASALEYLHHGYSFPIAHCDLKPNNILFDEDMVAHLGDFGIAKLFGEDSLVAHTRTLGTMGYMSPEYGSEGIVSTMADVYSFGILLMEVFTGKCPRDDRFTGELTMKKWVSELLFSGDISEIVVNSNLFHIVNEESFINANKFLRLVMALALECTEDVPENRINMLNVLPRLKRIQSELSSPTNYNTIAENIEENP